MNGLDDRWLQKLWRKACLKIFDHKCFFCGADSRVVDIEVHHLTKRNMLLLKHDFRNGIPLCKWVHQLNEDMKMSCHKFAETPEGKRRIGEFLERRGYTKYLTERSCNSKQWLLEHKMSRSEFLLERKLELEKIIKE